eukprot:NODE_265_length_11346_cov_0.635814.p11 type:complete len:117 gc:universal NODE_265_length_11346_cov_0.635814:1626-1976(+)
MLMMLIAIVMAEAVPLYFWKLNSPFVTFYDNHGDVTVNKKRWSCNSSMNTHGSHIKSNDCLDIFDIRKGTTIDVNGLFKAVNKAWKEGYVVRFGLNNQMISPSVAGHTPTGAVLTL